MDSLTALDLCVMLVVAIFCGGGMFFVLGKYLKRLRQIEDELFGKPVSPDSVLAFIRGLFKNDEETVGADS